MGKARAPAGASVAERVAAIEPTSRRERFVTARGVAWVQDRETRWEFWARPAQRAPDLPWRVWLIQAGRGFGKTRAGAEWVRSIAAVQGNARIALVAATMAEARGVMVEGESGVLAVAPEDDRPVWQPSLGRLQWKSGAVATLHSAAEPDSLRGPQFHYAWADEVAKWGQGPLAWDNLSLGLRLGRQPRVVVTTTPRPVPLVRRLRPRPTGW